MSFVTTGLHYCPDCFKGRKPGRFSPALELAEANYSGTGADMATCPKCGKGWCITYKVAGIERAEDWDRDFEEEKRWEREQAEKAVKDAEAELARAKERLGRLADPGATP